MNAWGALAGSLKTLGICISDCFVTSDVCEVRDNVPYHCNLLYAVHLSLRGPSPIFDHIWKITKLLQAARHEAESLLDASGRQAGMGGAAADTCHNAAFRGDCTCWVQHDQTEHPALKTTSDAIIAFQKGTACHIDHSAEPA